MIRYMLLLSVLILGRIVHGQDEIEGRIINVREGDIMQLVTDEKDTFNIKLANVDCPENGQEFFEEAKKFSEKLCLKKRVKFSLITEDEEGVKSGRLLLSKDKILNIELVEAGLAWHLRKGLQMTIDTKELNDKEEIAKQNQKGLWREKSPVAPWLYRRNLNKYEAKSSY